MACSVSTVPSATRTARTGPKAGRSRLPTIAAARSRPFGVAGARTASARGVAHCGDRGRRVRDGGSILVAEDDDASRALRPQRGGAARRHRTRRPARPRRHPRQPRAQRHPSRARARTERDGRRRTRRGRGCRLPSQISFRAASQSAMRVAASAAARFSRRSVGGFASRWPRAGDRGERASAQRRGVDPEVAERPRLERLALRRHDALEAGVARLPHLVGDGGDDGERRLDPVEPGGREAANARRAVRDGELGAVREQRHAPLRGDGPGHERASRVVRGHAHQRDVRRQLVQRGRQAPWRSPIRRRRRAPHR